MNKIIVEVSPVAPACVCGFFNDDKSEAVAITIPTSKQLLAYCYDKEIETVFLTGNVDYINGYINQIQAEELITYNENKINFVNIVEESKQNESIFNYNN